MKHERDSIYWLEVLVSSMRMAKIASRLLLDTSGVMQLKEARDAECDVAQACRSAQVLAGRISGMDELLEDWTDCEFPTFNNNNLIAHHIPIMADEGI